jgi:hypothetical protein
LAPYTVPNYNGSDMTVPPDLLKAFIDGKLAAEDASGVAAQIATDPDLAAYVEDQKALKAALASPAAAWLGRAYERVSAASASWIPASAMGAGILLGVLLAATYGVGTDIRSEGGALIAQGALAQVLNTALAAGEGSAPTAGVRIGPSFWSKNASFCRSFVTRGNTQSALAGLACRERAAWRIATIATIAPVGAASESVVAAELPASVRNVMDNLIVGEPLDAEGERQARNQGWQAR